MSRNIQAFFIQLYLPYTIFLLALLLSSFLLASKHLHFHLFSIGFFPQDEALC